MRALMVNKKRSKSSLKNLEVICNINLSGKIGLVIFNKFFYSFYSLAQYDFFIALPFIKNPEENPTFMVYFTRQWQDTMLISLHNLLAVSFQVKCAIFCFYPVHR
jgi:hypothetical protein